MRRLAALAAGAALLSLTACTVGGDEAKDEPDPRDVFLTSVFEAEFGSWEVDGPSETELLEFPLEWCRAADEGHSVSWMLEGGGSDDLYPIGLNWGTQLEDAEQVVILGIGAYCPERQEDAVLGLRDTGIDF